ncbi:Arsenate reductase [Leucobacter sp. BZR 635]
MTEPAAQVAAGPRVAVPRVAAPLAAVPRDSEPCTPSAAHAIGAEAATAVAGVLKALAEPLRLRMLSAIAADPRGESCVCDLAALADVAQPTVSHHLRVMKEAGVLESERRGTWVWYRLVPERRRAVTALLELFAPAALSGAAACDAERREALVFMDPRVTRLADDLANEFTWIDRERVMSTVRESFTALVRSAQPTAHLVPLTERFARQRLADMSRDRASAVPQVLFVCAANAGRSQLAAALLTEISGGRVIARSAGSAPAGEVQPAVRTLLAEMGAAAEAAAAFPKPLTDDAVRAADVVVTMGCGDVCPILPGVRYEDWPVGDPALASEAGVAAIRDDIAARVRVLFESLTQ